MFINSPPITLGCTRTGAEAFPLEERFIIPTVHTTPGTPNVLPGDLCVVLDLANNNNGVYPVNNTPVGFTNLFGDLGNQANGNLSKMNAYAKILAAADIGATKVGMAETENARKMVATFQMNRPVQSFTLLSNIRSGPQGTALGNLSLGVPDNADIGNQTGTQLAVFMSAGEIAHTPSSSGIIGSAPYNSVGTDPTGAVVSATRCYYSMYPFGTIHFTGPQFNPGDSAVTYSNAAFGIILKLT